MKFHELPKNMQEHVLKLASEHPITIEQATECYIMGGEHADKLCQLKAMNAPDYFIKLQNDALWAEKNKSILEELKSK